MFQRKADIVAKSNVILEPQVIYGNKTRAIACKKKINFNTKNVKDDILITIIKIPSFLSTKYNTTKTM